MSGYVLDTNCLNEIYTPEPNPGFQAWFRRQPFETLYTTAINAAEIWYGIECLPEGRKRTSLEHWRDGYFLPNFKGRILDFNLEAAKTQGIIRARNRRGGVPKPVADSMIASIAIVNGLGIVTRNARDFSGLDIEIVNPWS